MNVKQWIHVPTLVPIWLVHFCVLVHKEFISIELFIRFLPSDSLDMRPVITNFEIKWGYHINGDGVSCQDVDECMIDEYDCPSGLTCENLEGSYTCTVACQPGTERTSDGKSCTDIDECQTDQHSCQQVKICKNIRDLGDIAVLSKILY